MSNGDTISYVPSSAQPSKAPSVYRAVVHGVLVRLVSEGTGQLYEDACKYMDAEPALATQTHVAAHLLREIESSLRDVLQPLTSLSEELCEECGKPISGKQCICGRPKGLTTYQKEVDAILSALGFTADDPLTKAWRDLVEKQKLHKYAHRDSLEMPRPADAEFMEFWGQMEAVLTTVLDRFETKYADVFPRLDALIQKTTPTKQDAKTFSSTFPHNQTTHKYFFDNLKNSAWLAPLRAQGMFKKIPDPVRAEGGGVYYPPWPPESYLRHMVSIQPANVSEILLEVEDTENELVIGTLVDIAAELPEENRLPLMGRLAKWI